jgi:hypothetical protein
MGANFAMLNISRSQNNYNTASHKGLQSNCSLLATNDAPADSSINRPASKPLPSPASEALSMTIKAEPRSKPQGDNEPRTAQEDTVKLSIHPVSELKLSASPLHRSTSQPVQSATIAPAKASLDNELLSKPQKHLSVWAQQDQDHSRPKIKANAIGSTAPRATSEPPPLALPATGAPTARQLLSPIERRSEPVLFPQKIGGLNIPISRPSHPEIVKAPSANLPEDWAAELVTFNYGRVDGWFKF